MKTLPLLLVAGLLCAGCSRHNVNLESRVMSLESEVERLKKSLADANKQISDGNEMRKVIAAAAGQATQNSSLAADVLDTRLTQLEAAIPELRAENEELAHIVQLLIESSETEASPAPPP